MKDREQLNITCTKVTRQMLLAVQAEITQLAPRSKGRRIMPLNDVLVVERHRDSNRKRPHSQRYRIAQYQ